MSDRIDFDEFLKGSAFSLNLVPCATDVVNRFYDGYTFLRGQADRNGFARGSAFCIYLSSFFCTLRLLHFIAV